MSKPGNQPKLILKRVSVPIKQFSVKRAKIVSVETPENERTENQNVNRKLIPATPTLINQLADWSVRCYIAPRVVTELMVILNDFFLDMPKTYASLMEQADPELLESEPQLEVERNVADLSSRLDRLEEKFEEVSSQLLDINKDLYADESGRTNSMICKNLVQKSTRSEKVLRPFYITSKEDLAEFDLKIENDEDFRQEAILYMFSLNKEHLSPGRYISAIIKSMFEPNFLSTCRWDAKNPLKNTEFVKIVACVVKQEFPNCTDRKVADIFSQLLRQFPIIKRKQDQKIVKPKTLDTSDDEEDEN